MHSLRAGTYKHRAFFVGVTGFKTEKIIVDKKLDKRKYKSSIIDTMSTTPAFRQG